MPDENQDRIFLCHASEDKRQVTEIYYKLKAAGYSPWLDKMDILPGQQWDIEIKRALRNSRFIVIFFSNHSISKRGYVQREFKLALDTLEEIPDGQIFIIPVRLEECMVPEAFGHIHYVDLFEPLGFDLVKKVISAELGIPNQFTDPRDGQTYRTIDINGKIWLAENLNFEIENSWCYDGKKENCQKYGRLYTWEAAKKACPKGWHLPTDEEWRKMAMSYGGYYDRETKKDIGNSKASYSSLIKGGSSGFGALLGGDRNTDGSFLDLGADGFYWSAAERGGGDAYYYYFNGDVERLDRYNDGQEVGLSVRCLQN